MSAKLNTTFMSCSTMINVLPSVSWRISETAWSASLRFMPAVGSSRQDDVGAAGDSNADLKGALFSVGQHACTNLAPVPETEPFQQNRGCGI